jgi:hypothetical protein
MPLVCPDGAVVACALKCQLAGQAGASVVDRARYNNSFSFMRVIRLVRYLVMNLSRYMYCCSSNISVYS